MICLIIPELSPDRKERAKLQAYSLTQQGVGFEINSRKLYLWCSILCEYCLLLIFQRSLFVKSIFVQATNCAHVSKCVYVRLCLWMQVQPTLIWNDISRDIASEYFGGWALLSPHETGLSPHYSFFFFSILLCAFFPVISDMRYFENTNMRIGEEHWQVKP